MSWQVLELGQPQDETPIKASFGGHMMKATQFWSIYGEHDELCRMATTEVFEINTLR